MGPQRPGFREGQIPRHWRMETQRERSWPDKRKHTCALCGSIQTFGHGWCQTLRRLPGLPSSKWRRSPGEDPPDHRPMEKWKIYAAVTKEPQSEHVLFEQNMVKCPSIELRVTDMTKISSLIKSWLFQDQLEKPEDHVLYRSRTQGGLNLTNVKVKALSLLIKTFLETAS